MTERKRHGASKDGKGKQLNQTSLLDLFPKKQNATKKASVTANLQENTDEHDVEDLDLDKSHSSPVPTQQLAAVAISVEPESPKQPIVGLPRTPTRTMEAEIIDIADDQDPENDPTPKIISFDEPGTREDNPILVLDSSPIKPTTRSRNKGTVSHAQKPTYSIFAPRTLNQNTGSMAPRPSSFTSLTMEAPFPSGYLQHVRGPQTDFSLPPALSSFSYHNRDRQLQTNETFSTISLQDVIPINRDDPGQSQEPSPLRAHPSFTPNPSPSARTIHLSKTIPPYYRSHPVISHLIDAASATDLTTGDDDNRLWTDKWRPQRAEHVLHNENHAVYLRDWLSALELQLEAPPVADGSGNSQQLSGKAKGKGKSKGKQGQGQSKGAKRQRVVRAVDKKASRKRRKVDSDGDDDWIVPDHLVEEEEEQVWNDEISEPETEGPGSSDWRHSRLHRRGSDAQMNSPPAPSKLPPRHTFTHRLTNTVVLTGPPGSGKTAAVYACADELGWEVFEVYPGIGKRNASNLDNLVGDVGKNHLVRKAHGTNRVKEHDSSIKSLFLRKKRGEKVDIPEEDPSVDEEPEMINNRYRSPSTDFGFVEQASTFGEPSEAQPQVRQSLILLEEVDLLYRDDANFWPAVVGLIKDCKRPVILTCNDLSLVPTADLPLQDIREFEACPTQVATSFLHALCCAEGYMADSESLSKLCSSNSDYDSGKGVHCLDLRRAIQHCQTWSTYSEVTTRCSSELWKWRVDGEQKSDLVNWTLPSEDAIQGQRTTRRSHTELLSFGDCHMIRNVFEGSTITASSLGGIETTGDDVLGHPSLTFTSNSAFFGDNYDRDEMIMSTAINISRGGRESDDSYARDASLRRVRYGEFVRQFRNNGVVSVGERYRGQSLDMDYLPWIRTIVEADDEQEKESEKIKEIHQREGRRSTRNSQKGQHVRTITVNYMDRKGMENSQLGRFTC
ncbi:hypothetical protein PM082_005450 [Marasmius tenuissimus]|nr:hypothetical protein PM082_005450 [Marasmius tenuissimus]